MALGVFSELNEDQKLETKDISSISDILDDISINNMIDITLYRGQSMYRNLLPGAARKNPKDNSIKTEKEKLRQLRLLGDNFLGARQLSDLELMVIGQHYGLKTRLLDWTNSPLVALWFACKDKHDMDGYLYSLYPHDLIVNEDKIEDPFKTLKTVAFQPKQIDMRVSAQSGWFTLHKYSEGDKQFVPLEKQKQMFLNDFSKLKEYKIPAKNKKHILHELNLLGFSSRTIYPDLSGLCEHLNQY